ncbi:2-methylcitrate synthase/citrate synthase II [Halorubrum saccharovorum DSM 1137]|uniref:Citrate synthase n=1 Tax=Halorubrum saccharovorum DSM 1137 TaxID=1227484 RepID=M0DNL3_9EURY|nr:citrate synthase [Halorubrum saccharovorum]ELZ37076.1 2-methylcitrate synthase/citrate synthase II [Halorubrum saccharovorum DSM 1137]
MSDELKRGLEGVLVAESDLSYVDGEVGKLVYRGYDIEDLARGASYEEVLYLLWHGSLPTRGELDEFAADLAAERAVDDDVLDTVRKLADAGERPMAALRTAVSMLSAYEPEEDADPTDLDATLRKGRRITAKIPTVLAAFERARHGEDPVAPDPDLSHAANFLYMLTGTEPDEVSAETFDMALTLHADHGFNASTFTAIVIGSTMADVYSGVTGGIGALSGSLHGGANQDVMEVLQEVDASDKDPVQWVKDAREKGRRIPGFGHRVYKVKDPRAKILEEKLRDLSESSGDTKWLDYTTAIEEYLTEQGLLEKGIAPNVDFYSGSVYDSLGIPVDMYTPIFAMSRVGGWIAHVVQYQEDNRLIRPRARYTGPKESEFVPIDER